MLKRFTGERELSDRINPVLIKELRQAVRSRVFVSLFVLLQVTMILFVTFGMATASTSTAVAQTQNFFWTLVGFFTIVVLPMRGLGAVASEYRDGRFELLNITQLRATSIVRGKLISLLIQNWLSLLSLAPYLTLRYFAGSVNPLQELITLLTILYASFIVTNLTVSASAARTLWGRAFFFIFAGVILLVLSGVAAGAAVSSTYAGFFVMATFQGIISLIIFMAASSILERQTAEPMPLIEPTPYIAR